MRETILIGLLVLAWSPSAMAGDCPRWLRLDSEAKHSDVEGMISGHLDRNASKQYTSENKVAIRRCLRAFVPQIVEEIDQACSDRPGANADFVDDLFDRYLFSCI
jgi:uncharacterized membrane protein